MLDYEKYGNSFRTPRAMRPDGGPANNGFNGYDGQPSRTEGRPKAEPQAPRNPQQARPPMPQPDQGGGMLTFRQMQQQGQARPPMPRAPMTAPQMAMPDSGNPRWDARQASALTNPMPSGSPQIAVSPQHTGGGYPRTHEREPEVLRPPTQPFTPVNSAAQNVGTSNPGLEQQLRDMWQNYQSPGQFAGSAARVNLPDAYQGQSFNDEAEFSGLPAAYQGQRFGGGYSAVQGPQARETGQFSDPTGRVMGRTEQSVMEALDNPSAYGSDVVHQTFGRLAGNIDDDYNARDQALMAQAARRGLGGVGDSTVISNDARFQNLQRRSAKTDLADQLLERQAQTLGQDRAAAISQALGFGGQQFGQARSAYDTNRDTNQQNFGQDLAARGFESGERGREFGFGLDAARFNEDVGQRGYDNAFSRTREQNNLSQQSLDNRFRNAGYNNSVGQQGYQNRFDRAAAEQGMNQQGYENERSNYGLNRDAEQTGFQNKQALLSALLGYGQQGFENQMQTADMNDRRQREQQELLLKLMGVA